MYEDNSDIEVMLGSGIGYYHVGDGSIEMYPQCIFGGVLKYTGSESVTLLQITLDGGNRGFGNIFTVDAKESSVKVVIIDFRTRISMRNAKVEVQTKAGSHTQAGMLITWMDGRRQRHHLLWDVEKDQ